jgi:DNA-binding protein WhiA
MEKMGTVIWDELVNLQTSEPCSELKGFLEALPHTKKDEVVFVSCQRLVIGRRLLKLWKCLNESVFNATICGRSGSLELDKKLTRVCFKIPAALFEDITQKNDVNGTGKKWAWLRGLWGGCGALYLPQKGYYMTLRMKGGRKTEQRALRVLESAGIEPACREKYGKKEFIIRDQDRIVTCLSKMGLVRSSLIVEETAIMRSVKDKVNRLINCDSANIKKSLEAAVTQLSLVEKIESGGMWDRLTPLQAELAVLRRENPSASLGELGQLLSKPVSKSTVEYRWRRLGALITDEYDRS